MRNLRANPLVSAVSTAIIALSIFIFGLFLVIFFNFAGIFQKWGRSVAMDVYLEKGLKESQIELAGKKLEMFDGVDDVDFTSSREAHKKFKEMLGPQADLLDELGRNPLPASYRLQLEENARNARFLAELADKVRKIPGVAEVRYGAEWVERFQGLIQVLRMLGLVIGGILLLASVLIISNTIRLTVFSRREEIEIMRLVGATETFIRVPFFLEGLLQGFAAGLVAVGMLWVVYQAVLVNVHLPFPGMEMGQFVFLPPWGKIALVGGGTLLGVLGSSVALSRFLE